MPPWVPTAAVRSRAPTYIIPTATQGGRERFSGLFCISLIFPAHSVVRESSTAFSLLSFTCTPRAARTVKHLQPSGVNVCTYARAISSADTSEGG